MYTIILHGANQQINSDTYSNVALACVQNLTGYSLMTLSVMAVRPYPQFEGDTEEGVGGVMIETVQQRTSYEIAVEAYNFNDSADTNSKTQLMNILNKRYLFLGNVDYPHTLTCTNGVVDVVRTGYEIEQADPNYKFLISLAKRKVNP